MRFPVLISVATSILALTLVSGCTTAVSDSSPFPTSTFVAPYASDEEALAAAEDAYGEFVSVSNTILNNGGDAPERIASAATGEFLTSTVDSYRQFKVDGKKSVGEATFDSALLQRYSIVGGNVELITIYVCHDVSKVDLFGPDGKSLVNEDRQPRVRLEVTFDFDPTDRKLRVSERDVRSNSSC